MSRFLFEVVHMYLGTPHWRMCHAAYYRLSPVEMDAYHAWIDRERGE